MILLTSWKRMDWARAFSSDMWFTPKNWLSPNSRRFIWTLLDRGPRTLRAEQRETAGRRRTLDGGFASGGGAPLGVREDHRQDLVGVRRTAERTGGFLRPADDRLHEVVDLRGILLAAQVEPDLFGQLGGVADVPALAVARRRAGGVAKVGLAFLAVGRNPAVGPPNRDLGAHLAIGFVAPVDRQLGCDAFGEV